MKKTALLLCLFMVSVMMPQDVWAEDGISISGTEITIKSSTAGNVGTLLNTYYTANNLNTDESINAWKASVTKIILRGDPNPGQFNEADLSAISAASGFSAVTTVDMAEAKFVSESQHSNNYQLFHGEVSGTPSTGTQAIQNVSALYQSVQSTVWIEVSAPNDDVATEYSTIEERNDARLSSSLWSYAKVFTGNYKYCEFSTGSNWSSPSLSYYNELVPDQGHTTIEIAQYRDGGWIDTDENLAAHLNDYQDGDVIKVQRWYKKENDHWIRLTSDMPAKEVLYNYETSPISNRVTIFENPLKSKLNLLFFLGI